jgi:hypothetical protein
LKECFWLDNGRVMDLAYLLAVRNGIKTHFARKMKRLERSG